MKDSPFGAVLKRFGGILILMGLLVTGGCGQPGESSPEAASKESVDTADTEKPSDYHFQLKYQDMWGVTTLTVNGFPVHQSGGGHITDNPVLSIGLNTGLTGKGNRVSVRTEPMILGGQEIQIGPVELRGKVTRDYDGNYEVKGAKITEAEVDSAYEAWSERARKQWSVYRSRVEDGALDSMRAWASRNPLVVSTTFDNEAGPDFSRVFEEAPKLEDTPATRKRLKDYAMRLRDLMAEKDTSALFEEFRPSIIGRFKTHGFDSRSEFMAKNREAVVLKDAILDFGRSDVALRSWAGGRVWELWRKNSENSAFFERPSGYGMGELYVAKIDGELKVVR